MRSKIGRKLLAKTPLETKIFIDKYTDIVVLVNQLIKEKGYTKKSLAQKLDKSPSEISKWLNSEHNFTLRSLAKLEAELGETIIHIPRRKVFHQAGGNSFVMTVLSNRESSSSSLFTKATINRGKVKNSVA